METKMDGLQNTMKALAITLATLTTKEETQNANKLLDVSLTEVKKELLVKQTETFGDINSKYDTKFNEIESKLDAASLRELEQDVKLKDMQAQLIAEKYKVSLLQKQIEDVTESPVGYKDLQNQIEELKDMVIVKNDSQDREMQEAS
jgi:hypothetical protein